MKKRVLAGILSFMIAFGGVPEYVYGAGPTDTVSEAVLAESTLEGGSEAGTPKGGNETEALESEAGALEGESEAGMPESGSEAGVPEGENGAGAPEGGNEAEVPEGGSEAGTPEGGNEAGALEGGNEAGTPEDGSEVGVPEGGNEADAPESGIEAETPEDGNEAGTPESGSEAETPEDKESENSDKKDAEDEEALSVSEAQQENWLAELKIGIGQEMERQDALKPAFSPQIHEYDLYVPDYCEGIYGFGTSVLPDAADKTGSTVETVKASYISVYNEKFIGEDAVRFAQNELGEPAYLKDLAAKGTVGNTLTLQAAGGTKDYVIHIRRKITLNSLNAVYENQEYSLFNGEDETDRKENSDERSFELTLPWDCKEKTLELFPEPFACEENGLPGERYQITVNGTPVESGSPYVHTLSGKEETLTILVTSASWESVEYNVRIRVETAMKADGYLKELSVYSSANGTPEQARQELVRREDLDETLGGMAYTVDYSSMSSSSSFYVAAGLSENAPEGAKMTLSAYTRDGQMVSTEITADSFEKSYRYRLSGNIFGSGEDGARRGVYTITVGNDTEQEVYKIVVCRTLDLASVGCYHPDDTDLARSLLTPKYNRTIREYQASLSDYADFVRLVIRPFSKMWFNLKVNGNSFASNDALEVPIGSGTTDVVLSMEQEETYNDPEYAGMTYASTGEYHIGVTKLENGSVDFKTDPEDAIVSLYDKRGERINASLGNPFHFPEIMVGETYTYNVSCYGYIGQRESFTAEKENEISVKLEPVDSRQEETTDNEWWNYRNNEENNGVTDVSTPNKKEEVMEKWSVQLGGDWNASSTPPLILDGYLYTAAGKFVYKLDKETGEIVTVSDELAGSLLFALNPLVYGEGMIFAQIGNGQVQALSAKTLKSLWISEPIGGQTVSPITYKSGYIYTGTWNSETTAGSYFCLSVTDEDPSRGDEIKYCTWKYSHKGGFYWAGSYATDKYLVFGSDDGSDEGVYTDTSIIYSVSSKSGILIDKIEGLKGDIRTSIVYENGCIYFATKGGWLYRIRMGEDGSFQDVASCELGGMATASPVVYKGRIYIGVSGKGGQFSQDGGHTFQVLQETEGGISHAYSVDIPGYPQAGALLSTAYEKEDFNGDGRADGRVYVYFTYNAFPGGIYALEDEPGKTNGSVVPVFEPDTAQQQYCISTICVDKDGTLYYKNDSSYLIAVGTNSAYLEDLKVTADQGKVKWNKSFRTGLSKYRLMVEHGAKQLNLSLTLPKGRTATVNGEKYNGTCTVKLDENQCALVEIAVTDGKKSRVYTLDVSGAGNDATLSGLVVSASNAFSDTNQQLGLSPEFSPERTFYTTDVYEGNREFLNLFTSVSDKNASVNVTAISGVKKILNYQEGAGSGANLRTAVYFGNQESLACVDVEVTSGDKTAQRTYRVNLNRTDVYPPVLSDVRVVRKDASHGEVTFTSNENGRYDYQIVKPGEKPNFDFSQAGRVLAQGENKITVSTPAGEGADIYIIAQDLNGIRMEEPVKLTLASYKKIRVSISVKPKKAEIKVADENGNILTSEKGIYEFLAGNRYTISLTCSGYAAVKKIVTAEEKTTSYKFTMESTRSSNAELKNLYVSSSAEYGTGILKLTPKFSQKQTRYSVVYGAERNILNVWPVKEDKEASVKVYALGGIDASTVLKDETIREKTDDKGRSYWPVTFASEQFEAKVRVCVTAEDGTVKNTFLTLLLTDKTPPALRKISAARISTDKASVVFLASEKGTYYYEVADAGTKAPSVDISGKGIDVLSGTVTFMLENLSKGEKNVYIVMKDAAGNVSDTLVVPVPDVKNNGYQGQAQGGIGGGGQSSSGLGGKKPVTLSKKDGQGSAADIRKPAASQQKHQEVSDKKKSDKNLTEKAKELGKKGGKKSGKEKKSKTPAGERIEGSSAEGMDSSSLEKPQADMGVKAGAGLWSVWKESPWTYKLTVLLALVGFGYLLFWWKAKRVYRKLRVCIGG